MRRKYFGISFKPAQISELKAELTTESLTHSRPNRQTVINQDDIINLRIALETSKNLEEFLSIM